MTACGEVDHLDFVLHHKFTSEYQRADNTKEQARSNLSTLRLLSSRQIPAIQASRPSDSVCRNHRPSKRADSSPNCSSDSATYLSFFVAGRRHHASAKRRPQADNSCFCFMKLQHASLRTLSIKPTTPMASYDLKNRDLLWTNSAERTCANAASRTSTAPPSWVRCRFGSEKGRAVRRFRAT